MVFTLAEIPANTDEARDKEAMNNDTINDRRHFFMRDGWQTNTKTISVVE
jgi:hypothetical protein